MKDECTLTQEEKNKLIERTAKHDAYQRIVMWGKREEGRDKYGSALWFAKEKMEGHKEYIEKQEWYYEYSTSTFHRKNK